ncbi:tetratricopeptide repeat protein [Nostoc sp. NMS4]|uniref:tetratricopeptide repeat protein n=1 Tax=Nostoc sp. NMS4 TaxID=2815390 RepID=UPI0025E3C2EF|nr:tetratricopeptide repeat protein [Nostoc sp. NMS4]MBN3925476.1 tetratricopeptide repeat protein [Nostoc sp. NMS4]
MKEQLLTTSKLAETAYQLASVWQSQEKIELAIALYQEALNLEPNYLPAYQKLGDIIVKEGRVEEGLEYYEKALYINFDATTLSSYYAYLGLPETILNHQSIQTPKSNFSPASYIEDNLNGKISLFDQKTFDCHRSGWNFVTNALKPLHNSQGILFDGFIENRFLWNYRRPDKLSSIILEKIKQDGTFNLIATVEERGIIPYTKPWVGIIHNPQRMPTWFQYRQSPQELFAKETWKKSLDSCVGLFSLSEYHAQWLREQTGKPVSTLIHPTEIPEMQFNFSKFLANSEKKIVQIGWWLRKLSAIYQLPIAKNNPLNLEKIRLVPMFCENADKQQEEIIEREKIINNITIEPIFLSNTREIKHLSNTEYDILLSENIVFIELYDSSANNGVIECIARATPLLINPLPAVVEYLGKDYPMYFTSLSEAAEKALDTALILDTHNYLLNCETRKKLSQEYFLKSFEESEVYQLI